MQLPLLLASKLHDPGGDLSKYFHSLSFPDRVCALCLIELSSP